MRLLMNNDHLLLLNTGVDRVQEHAQRQDAKGAEAQMDLAHEALISK
jgi:hypothetical protein